MMTKRAPSSLKQKKKKRGGGFAARLRHPELAVFGHHSDRLKGLSGGHIAEMYGGIYLREGERWRDFSPFPYWIRSMICPKGGKERDLNMS